jgi:hypothetical protein
VKVLEVCSSGLSLGNINYMHINDTYYALPSSKLNSLGESMAGAK